MKKLVVTLLTLGLILSLETTAFAKSPHATIARAALETGNAVAQKNDTVCGAAYCGFVDEDNDGICDNCNSHNRFADANGDGVCDNIGAQGACFADANGDGICDNLSTGNSKGGGSHHGGQ